MGVDPSLSNMRPEAKGRSSRPLSDLPHAKGFLNVTGEEACHTLTVEPELRLERYCIAHSPFGRIAAALSRNLSSPGPW
jgi:hypothetical protein